MTDHHQPFAEPIRSAATPRKNEESLRGCRYVFSGPGAGLWSPRV